MLEPTDMVLVFLITKPLFLLGCLLLIGLRHASRGQRAIGVETPRALLEE